MVKGDIFPQQDAPDYKAPDQSHGDDGSNRIETDLTNDWNSEPHPDAQILK